MSEEIKVLIEEEPLISRVKEVAEQINREYEGREIYLLCILKGSVYFMFQAYYGSCQTGIYECVQLRGWDDELRRGGH